MIISSRRQRYSRAFGALLGFGMLAYVLYVGLSMLAHWISPGVWGYIGAAGYIALIAPLPALVIMGGISRFVRRWGVLMLGGAVTIVVSAVAGRLGWSGWVPLVLIVPVTAAYLAIRAVMRAPVRLARWRAERMLQRHRPAQDERWSHQDWEWAFTRVGTPAALREAAFSRALRRTAADPPLT
jgi:hypothetical protein